MFTRAMLTSLLLVAPVAAQTPPARTSQAIFDSAQAAFEKGDWNVAISGFREVLAHMKPTSRAAPAVHSRLATALSHIGENGAATTEMDAAVAGFAALKITKDGDLAAADLLRGDQQRARLENEQAITSYQAAITAADGADARLATYRAHIGLGYAAMTVRPDVAAAALDAELGDAAFFASLGKTEQAKLWSGRAMAELNRGHPKDAVRFSDKALGLVGSTTTQVNLAQVGIRGNAALIYAQLGRDDDVREALTYSGAGHLPNSDWLMGADMPLPLCGADIAPDDVAVVEFAIGTDGRTIGAAAIYASHPGTIGTTFAASVKTWRWRPAAAAKLNPFWRASVRMELRCVKRTDPIQLSDSFRDATERWLAQTGYAIDFSDPAAAVPATAPDSRGAALARAFLAVRSTTSDKARTAAYAALEQQLVAANAPVAVRAYAAFQTVRASNGPIRGSGGAQRAGQLDALTARFDTTPDAGREAAWFRTETALQIEANGGFADARERLGTVASLPIRTLPADDPIRSLAMLHLSLIDKRGGKAAEADSRLAAAGIDKEQCSLLDVRPVARNTAISSSTFPGEAVRWHFEGRVSEAFDIAADGSVSDVRTVIAYPPFVFGPATERAVRRFRYLPPTLGDQPLGCTGQTVNVRYVLPE